MSGSISRARPLAALVFATLFFRLRAPCCAWTGKVIGVTDGDSITVPHDGGGEQIRLWGIDCPEKRQEFGTKAKQATSTLVFGKFVQVDPVTTDRYRRMLAFVRVGDTLLNEESIRQGLTWVCTRYCDRPVCQESKKLEKEARKARRGLWLMPQPVAPWEFRKGTRKGGVAKVADVHQPPLVVVHRAPRALSERP